VQSYAQHDSDLKIDSLLHKLVVYGEILESVHTKFMGIPMMGYLQEFAEKLQTGKNLRIVYNQDGVIMMKGRFSGSDCRFLLYSNPDNTIGRVVVLFPGEDTWPPLEKQYYRLKERLSEKYGVMSSSKEEFRGHPSSDVGKFYAVLRDECTYQSKFDIESLGSVMVMIIKDFGDTTACVSVGYTDISCTLWEMKSQDEDL